MSGLTKAPATARRGLAGRPARDASRFAQRAFPPESRSSAHPAPPAEEAQLQSGMEQEDGLQSEAAPAQREVLEEYDEELDQGKFAAAQRATSPSSSSGEGALPDNLRHGIESLSGVSMDGVRVHYNSSKPSQLDALAYTRGSDIHLAPGQERHLPHEAWHVAQQAQGRVRATTEIAGVPINDDQGLEREADAKGAQAASKRGLREGER